MHVPRMKKENQEYSTKIQSITSYALPSMALIHSLTGRCWAMAAMRASYALALFLMREPAYSTAHLVRFCCSAFFSGVLLLFSNLCNEKRSADCPITFSYFNPSAANPASSTVTTTMFSVPHIKDNQKKTFQNFLYQAASLESLKSFENFERWSLESFFSDSRCDTKKYELPIRN